MKIILLSIVLMCKIYGANFDKLMEHQGAIFRFRQCVSIFSGNFLEVRKAEDIPYENLEREHLDYLKLAINCETCFQQMPNVFSKEIAIVSKFQEIRLKARLIDLENISDAYPKFTEIRELAKGSLKILLRTIAQEKPKVYKEKGMKEWIENWQNAIISLAQLQEAIREALLSLEPNNKALKLLDMF